MRPSHLHHGHPIHLIRAAVYVIERFRLSRGVLAFGFGFESLPVGISLSSRIMLAIGLSAPIRERQT